MSLKIKYIKISCRTKNSKYVFWIDLKDKSYYTSIYNYKEQEINISNIIKDISNLNTEEIIDYFDNLEDKKEFEISDYVIKAKYTMNEYEDFKHAIQHIVQSIKEILEEKKEKENNLIIDVEKIGMWYKTTKMLCVTYIDILKEIYETRVYELNEYSKDFEWRIGDNYLSHLDMKEVIEYIKGKIKYLKERKNIKEVGISDGVLYCIYSINGYENFKKAVQHTLQKIKKEVKKQQIKY